jgi:hypothetical protein
MIFLLIFALHTHAQGWQSTGDVTDKVRGFYQNPSGSLQQPALKFDSQGKIIRKKHPLLADLTDDQAYAVKMRDRQTFLPQDMKIIPKKIPAEPMADDRAEELLNRTDLLKDPFTMHKQGLDKATVANPPWSGDYWAIYKGILGQRFLDTTFAWANDWSVLFAYIQKFTFMQIFQAGDPEKMDQLSTSEKYDLIMGDTTGSLTKNMWQQGKEYYDSYGKVETWMGICHGWSAAAIAVPRPEKSIVVRAFDDKTPITLHPSEIKGLASYLWATTPYKSFFIGGRCNFKDVPKDEFGRPTAQECRDTNPATWHIAMVNSIGVDKRSFVMDATMDYEVWNQPILGYSIKYFNPRDQKEVGNPEQATIKLSEWDQDPFKKFRSKKAQTAIGILMQVRYVVEEAANDRDVDNTDFDFVYTAEYMYDLELDSNRRIVGGEWMTLEHPDFLWVPANGSVPLNYEDKQIKTEWSTGTSTPADWQEAARWASQGGRVLSKAVTHFVNWSNSTE